MTPNKQAVPLFSKGPSIIFCEGIRPKLANKLSLTAIRNIKALTWMLDLPKKTLFFHSVFSLRYCAALENTNCLRYRPDDSSAIPELTVAAGDTAVPELVADRRARALWTKKNENVDYNLPYTSSRWRGRARGATCPQIFPWAQPAGKQHLPVGLPDCYGMEKFSDSLLVSQCLSSPSTHSTKCDEGYDEARQIKLPQLCITYLFISTL